VADNGGGGVKARYGTQFNKQEDRTIRGKVIEKVRKFSISVVD
jgi:hypothetical protein